MMSTAVDPRPNILWISTHDTSAWNYGCYGDEYSRTPRIDGLAAEGVRYSNAFTAGPICSPSRSSIYTGMHPTTLGTHHHRSAVIRPDGVELLPKMFRTFASRPGAGVGTLSAFRSALVGSR